MTSLHYSTDRIARENLIRKIGIGNEIATFTIDRGHKNGPELHTVTSNAIIIVRNAKTNKIVTKLIARPNQIKRYFTNNKIDITEILKIAQKHQELGYNMI